MIYVNKSDKYAQEDVIERLKTVREVLEWSRNDMAAALNVPYSTYCRWEKGAMQVQHKTILMKALQTLLREENNGKKTLGQTDNGVNAEGQGGPVIPGIAGADLADMPNT
jgi:ribosome-binding protein aMBF1 (putative translation factor)